MGARRSKDVYFGDSECQLYKNISKEHINENGILFFTDQEGSEHYLAPSTQWHLVIWKQEKQ